MKNRIWKSTVVAATVLCAAAGAWGAGIEDDFARAGQLHRNGETAAAMAIWQHWAARGDADAAYNLALIHHYGDGVPRDEAKALAWYRMAAGRGDRLSHYMARILDPNEAGAAGSAGAHRGHAPAGHEMHHQEDAQTQAWREEAARLIREREWREALAAAHERDQQVVDELRRRAGLPEAAASPDEAGGADPALR